MAIQVERESLTTKSRHVSPTYVDANNVQYLIGSEKPLPTIDISQLRLQEGRAYSIGAVAPFSAPLAPNANIDIAIAFPSGLRPNVEIFGLCAGNAMGYLYEGASVTGGTPVTALNKNRNSATASQSAILINPTVNFLGTLILEQILLGGEGKKASGGDVGGSDIILKPLTTYLFRLTNVNGVDHAAEIILGWTE